MGAVACLIVVMLVGACGCTWYSFPNRTRDNADAAREVHRRRNYRSTNGKSHGNRDTYHHKCICKYFWIPDQCYA